MPDYKGDNLNVDIEDVWETATQGFPAMPETSFATTLLSAALTVGGIVASGGTSAVAQTASPFSLAEPGLSVASSAS